MNNLSIEEKNAIIAEAMSGRVSYSADDEWGQNELR